MSPWEGSVVPSLIRTSPRFHVAVETASIKSDSLTSSLAKVGTSGTSILLITAMPSVHTSGSWFRQGKQQDTMQWLRDNGFDVVCDWTSKEHQEKSKAQQLLAIYKAIETCDICYFSFEGMEDRTHSATFFQFAIAAARLDKPVIVYDPAKATRSGSSAHPSAHPALNNLMGHALHLELVHWTDNLADAQEKLKSIVILE